MSDNFPCPLWCSQASVAEKISKIRSEVSVRKELTLLRCAVLAEHEIVDAPADGDQPRENPCGIGGQALTTAPFGPPHTVTRFLRHAEPSYPGIPSLTPHSHKTACDVARTKIKDKNTFKHTKPFG